MKFSYTWQFSGKKLGRISAGTVLPGLMTARFDYEGEDHDVEMDIAVRDGKPQVDAIRVLRSEGLPALNGTELKRLPFDDLLHFAVTQAGTLIGQSGNLGPPQTEEEARTVARDVGKAIRRRTITDDLLREFLELWRAGGRGVKGIEHAAKEMPASESQAWRYLRQAKDRGLLPPSEGEN